MKIKLCFLIMFFFVWDIYSQTEDEIIDNKYLSAIIYLKTNDEIVKKVNNFHGYWLKNKKIKQSYVIDFNISKYIKFMPINDFTEEDSNRAKSYREKYFFKSEENLLLEKILPKSDSKLYLIFSKPIDNYLCAEFILNTGFEIDLVDNINGPVMRLMFIFDNNNVIKEVKQYISYIN